MFTVHRFLHYNAVI